MKKVVISILAILFAINLALAVEGYSPEDNDGNPTITSISDIDEDNLDEEIIDNQNRGRNNIERVLDSNGRLEQVREKLQEKEQLRVEKIGMNITRDNGELIIDQNRQRVRTKLDVSLDENGTVIRTRLSNGRNAEIKLMPSTASQVALERLRLKVCTEERNCTIELKEVGNGDKEDRVVYEASLDKEFKVFGLIKSKRRVMVQVDAETGEIVKTQKPWWSFLATEEKNK
jgi:hypothetical protein